MIRIAGACATGQRQRQGASAPVSLASSHRFGPSPDRRRLAAAARRGHPRPPRRALPRRARRVSPRRARGAAPAARGGLGQLSPGPAAASPCRAGSARRRLQPVSLRPRARLGRVRLLRPASSLATRRSSAVPSPTGSTSSSTSGGRAARRLPRARARAPRPSASASRRARRRQEDRLGPGRCNAEMTPAELRRHCRLDRRSRANPARRPRPARSSAAEAGTGCCGSRGRSPTSPARRSRVPSAVGEALDLRRRPER